MTGAVSAAFAAALEVDRVLSAAQRRSHFAGAEDPPGLRVFRRSIMPLASQKACVDLELCSFEPRLERLSTLVLGHLLGCAAMRLRLGARPEDWSCRAEQMAAGHRPDALWYTASGVVAVEYDSGAYLGSTVLAKLERFSGYPGGLIWGVSSRARRAKLARRLPGVRVLEVNYWGAAG